MTGEVGARYSSPTYVLPIDTIQLSLSLPPSGGAGGGDSPAPITSRVEPPLVPRYLRNFKGGFIDEGPSIPEDESHQERLFEGWEVTAGGVRPRSCGEDLVQMFCESCGHWFRTPRTCHERTCPVCGMIWSYKQGANMAFRMKATGRHPASKGAWGREIIVSSPKKTHTRLLEDDKYVKYKRNQVYGICQRMGVRGGGAVFHPYRKDHETDHYDVDGPHFHVVGWCDKLKGMGDDEFKRLKKEGWIFWGTTKKDGRAKRYKSWPQWYRKCQYELSHCAIIPGMHAFTWFGICNTKIVPLHEMELAFRQRASGHPCPECGSLWSTPLGLINPDAEMEKKPHVGHIGQTRLKTGSVPIRLGRHRTPL